MLYESFVGRTYQSIRWMAGIALQQSLLYEWPAVSWRRLTLIEHEVCSTSHFLDQLSDPTINFLTLKSIFHHKIKYIVTLVCAIRT